MSDYEKINLVSYSDQQLIDGRNQLSVKYGEYIERCAEEVGELIKKPNFDPYSRSGERQINKIMKKYTPDTSGISLAIEYIDKELEKREQYNYEQGFLGKKYYDDKISEKEFFERETLKTLKYKQSINIAEDDE